MTVASTEEIGAAQVIPIRRRRSAWIPWGRGMINDPLDRWGYLRSNMKTKKVGPRAVAAGSA